MHRSEMKGKMRQARGQMKQRWAKLTDDDVRLLDGKIDEALGILQERYAYTTQHAWEELSEYVQDYGERTQELTQDIVDRTLDTLNERFHSKPSFMQSVPWMWIALVAGGAYMAWQFMKPEETSQPNVQ